MDGELKKFARWAKMRQPADKQQDPAAEKNIGLSKVLQELQFEQENIM